MNPIEFRNAVGGDPAVPEKGDLEEAAEQSTHCGRCGGQVRAFVEDVDEGGIVANLEILVSFRCRDAACPWSSRQWRPWQRAEPGRL